MKPEITYQVGVEVLQNVLQVSYDSRLAYQQLMTKTNDENIEEWLGLKVEHLSEFISEMLKELDTMYINPVLKSSFNAKLERFLFDVKYIFTDVEDVVIINKSLKLDNALYNYIAREIKAGMYSKNVYTLFKEEMSKLHLMIQPNDYIQLQAA